MPQSVLLEAPDSGLVRLYGIGGYIHGAEQYLNTEKIMRDGHIDLGGSSLGLRSQGFRNERFHYNKLIYSLS